MTMRIKSREMDIEKNYNDDLPYKQIVDFLNSEDCGLVILNGDAGTGKTSLIRHFIKEIDKDFLYLDQSSFDNITDVSFLKEVIQKRYFLFIRFRQNDKRNPAKRNVFIPPIISVPIIDCHKL